MERIVAESVEARQHDCEHCGHHGTKHAFDVFPIDDSVPEKCWKSCIECFDAQTKRLEKEKNRLTYKSKKKILENLSFLDMMILQIMMSVQYGLIHH